MTRRFFIERTLRQIYSTFPTDDSEITYNLVNSYLNDGVAVAAKQCYKEAIQLDGIGYVNNSFYSTFKGITVSQDENNVWKLDLPQIPVAIGRNEGISTLKFKSKDNQVSLPCIPLSANQTTYYQVMRLIPNKVLYYSQGKSIYALSTLLLNQYTATVTMISGGLDTDLDSTFILPDDYYPVVVDYLKSQLVFERMQIQDNSNDGVDNK